MNPAIANRVAGIVLGVCGAGLLLGAWRLFAAVDIVIDPWTIVLFVLTVAGLLLAFSGFVRFHAKRNLALLAVTLIVSFLGLDYALRLAGRNLIGTFDAKVEQPARAAGLSRLIATTGPGWQSSRPVDLRSEVQVGDDLAAAGIPYQYMLGPSPLLLPVLDDGTGNTFFPLGMTANTIVLGCNEGDQRDYPVLRTDRYGFNNDDTVYAHKDLIALVGGSFMWGSCVHQDENIAAVLTRNGYPAYAMALGQFGPLAILETLKEYAAYLRPRIVLWQYFDPNDVRLLENTDLRSSILLRYLQDGFSQDLIHRQDSVNRFWAEVAPLRTARAAFLKSPALEAEWETRLDQNLPIVQQALGNDIRTLRDDESLLTIYRRIFEIAQRRVSAWGGRIYLVIIPNSAEFSEGTVPVYETSVVKIMSRLKITTIDFGLVMRATGDPLQFYPNRARKADHLTPEGYRLLARQIMEQLDADARR